MTPLSAQGVYQLITFGAQKDADSAVAKLDAAVRVAFSHLQINDSKFLAHIGRGPSQRAFDPHMPTVGVFLGTSAHSEISEHTAKKLAEIISHGSLIIPVVPDIAKFTQYVPASIHHLNGLSYGDCGASFERLAGRVLEGFGLLRERRRLFISYRRAETSGIATQCYEALDAAGFDVFLDTQGVINPGAPFQEILWHRLVDTDVILLLDSPGFSESRWTTEELARANQSNIQILQLLWPGREDASASAFSTFHPLTPSEFVGPDTLGVSAQLTTECLVSIVDLVEGLRARALGSRHASLVREFLVEATAIGHRVHQTLDRNLLLATSAGSTLIQPAVGVPSSEHYENLMDRDKSERARGRSLIAPSIVLYDQQGIRERWVKHLEWLNGNIAAVKSLGITNAREWLAAQKK